jgi:hypothetical protein
MKCCSRVTTLCLMISAHVRIGSTNTAGGDVDSPRITGGDDMEPPSVKRKKGEDGLTVFSRILV